MLGVLVGFAIIAAVILAGYIVGRVGVLGESAPFVLNRIGFFVLSPCLLFTVLADADVHALFSSLLVVSFIAAASVFMIYAFIARVFWRRDVATTVIGSLGSGYLNASNIGIPVAFYVLGDAALSAPVVLLQLLVFAPVALTILDRQTRDASSVLRTLVQPFTNPIIVGSLLGVLIAVTGLEVPEPVMEPFRIIGAAAVPVILIAFGMSLHGQRPMAAGTARRDVVLASALKLAVMPAIAWVIGQLVFHLPPEQVFGAVLLSALPSAQNVFNYAQRYDRAVVLARDVVLITTVLSLPVLVAVAALLAPR